MKKSGARTLLIGGQACVLYGAAEFSRDLDLLILTDPENIALVRFALENLNALRIAVPDFDPGLLDRGHAVHFRCSAEEVAGLRIDLMSTLRGVDDFGTLWGRRTTFTIEGETIEVVSPADLVLAKKTQRDKDWPMITRLLEENYFAAKDSSDPTFLAFWFREMRTPELLIQVAAQHPDMAARSERAAVQAALRGDLDEIADALYQEQREERAKDRAYWEPLKRELEEFRRNRPR